MHTTMLLPSLGKSFLFGILLYLPTYGGRGTFVFGVVPVGVGLVWHFLVCRVSCEPVVGFLTNFHGYIIGTKQGTD